MLHNVLTKTVRDRTVSTLVGAVSVGVMLLFGMAVYREVDVTVYQQLPEAILDLMGIPAGADVGALAYGAMYDLIGAFVLAGLAVGMGASAIAGEEQEGTLGLLLGNPLSRRRVLASKSMSIILVTGFGALILWAFGALAPSWLDVDTSGLHLVAILVALFVNALVYGFLALGIGSSTGNRGLASGVSVAVMVIGYLAANLFPLTVGLAWIGEFFPWHYYSSSQPLINGLDWGHIAVMTGLVVVSFTVAFISVDRRDLKDKGAGKTIVDRLRANPRTQKVMDRIAGSARVSRISMKTMSDSQTLLVITGAIMFYMGILIGPLYGLIPDEFIDFFRDFPDALIAMIGGADMSTAAGFFQAEIFSITGPVAIIVLTASMGARALAGEEETHTMGLLLANPISRTWVLLEKVVAMVAYAVALGAITFLGCWLGVLIGGVDLTVEGLAATSALMVLFGLVWGGVALLVTAATGRSRLASGITASLAVVAYFTWSFFPLSETFAAWAVLSPFQLYLGSDPLATGMDWADAGVLTAIFAILVVASIPLFDRRDLRG